MRRAASSEGEEDQEGAHTHCGNEGGGSSRVWVLGTRSYLLNMTGPSRTDVSFSVARARGI